MTDRITGAELAQKAKALGRHHGAITHAAHQRAREHDGKRTGPLGKPQRTPPPAGTDDAPAATP